MPNTIEMLKKAGIKVWILTFYWTGFVVWKLNQSKLGISRGLIIEINWSNAYRVYFVGCRRANIVELMTPRNVNEPSWVCSGWLPLRQAPLWAETLEIDLLME